MIGHDPNLVGWPWVEATHSWLEPTALAILALCRGGLAEHPRVKAGVDLILDRALEAGGWNYGNKAVFGTELRPQPGPTGLALLALAAVGTRREAVSRGLTYLREAARDLRAPDLARLGSSGPPRSQRRSRRRGKVARDRFCSMHRQARRRHGTRALAAGIERRPLWD